MMHHRYNRLYCPGLYDGIDGNFREAFWKSTSEFLARHALGKEAMPTRQTRRWPLFVQVMIW